jgi:hypothetical protein
MKTKPSPFYIHSLPPKPAVMLPEGIQRLDALWVPEWHAFVKCTQYENHFIYATKEMGPAYRCTCGSNAVIVPPIPSRGVLVCMAYAVKGMHQ